MNRSCVHHGWEVSTARADRHGGDTHAVVSSARGLWVVVADGATAAEGSSAAARLLTDTAIAHLITAPITAGSARRAIRCATRSLRRACALNSIDSRCASTLTIVGVTDARTVVATCGDSPVWKLSESSASALTDRAARFIDSLHPSLPTVELLPALGPGQALVIATDGVLPGIPAVRRPCWAHWSPQRLVDSAVSAGSADDITVIRVNKCRVNTGGQTTRGGRRRHAVKTDSPPW